MNFDPQLILMVAFLAVIILFMFRNSRKRRREAEKLQEQVVVGADVMTNFGLFGTIVSMDEDENKVDLVTGPGTIVTVHRQTIGRVISPEEPVVKELLPEGIAEAEPAAPRFGERAEHAPESGQDKAPE
jgi:preprotein translocase subunit YajC